MKPHRYFMEVMSKEQKLKFTCMVGLWLCALVGFWSWWLRQEHIVTMWGMVSNSIVIGRHRILPARHFFFVYRLKIANPEARPATETIVFRYSRAFEIIAERRPVLS
jgi:hypothetical protein